MNRIRVVNISAVTALGLVLSFGSAVAQEKQHVSFSTPAENTKATETSFDVGDLPNHIVRVFEIHRTYPNDAPVINGAKIVESWTRGMGDRIDGTGTNMQYVVFVTETGDKVFARMDGFAVNDAGITSVTIAGRIVGGTGKLARIQGLVREAVKAANGRNENRTDIEYTVGK